MDYKYELEVKYGKKAYFWEYIVLGIGKMC